MFDLSHSEVQAIDSALEPKLAWAVDRRAVAEQMAVDASRILSCVEDRVADYVGRGFFNRCWFALSGKTGEVQRANQNDLIEMQKYAWRYLQMLQERDLLLAQSMIVVKNNLLTLAVRQDEIRKEVNRLADRVYDRFVALEERVAGLEVSSHYHGWLLTLDMRGYEQRYTKNLRLLKVVSDFYSIKNDAWNVMELWYLQKGLSELGLDPDELVSVGAFVNGIIDEIEKADYPTFAQLMAPDGLAEISNEFVIEAIAAPTFSSLFQIKDNYTANSRVIRSLQKKLNISHPDAMKDILADFISELGIDVTTEIPVKDLATELASCFSLIERLGGIISCEDDPKNENGSLPKSRIKSSDDDLFNKMAQFYVNDASVKTENNSRNYLLKNYIELLEKIEIEKYQSGSIYFFPNIPKNKEKNARESMSISGPVFCLIDATVFGSSSEGVAFADDGVYWKTTGSDSKSIKFIDLLEIIGNEKSEFWIKTYKKNASKLCLSEKETIELLGSSVSAETCRELMAEICIARREMGS